MKITVIGVGYVGLTTGVCLAEIGNDVLCVDKDKIKIVDLKQGKIPIYEPGLADKTLKNYQNKKLNFSTSIKEGIDFADVIFIAVGTPAKYTGEADLTSVETVVVDIAKKMTTYKIIVSKSTVPVETGKKIQETIRLYNRTTDFDIVSNPEFLREGSAVSDFLNPYRIVLGVNSQKAKDAMLEVYQNIDAPKIITDIESAELIKHASNSFLALKISYANALSRICEKVGADIEFVTQGMGYDSRIGKDFLNAGVGFGGSCFPKDLAAFIDISNNCGYNFQLLKEVQKINDDQKQSFIDKIKEIVWNLKGKKFAVLGLSFKPNTDDMREAPSLDIIDSLLKEGAIVTAFDPVATKNAKAILGDAITYAETIVDATKGADAVIILTEWADFKNIDVANLKLKTPIIIDGRNIFDPLEMKKKGYIYKGIGR
ncbi:MAG: UDP-glucose/GDP-mannose dehydrogenase family protein [bacterium]|nr:UDP-glucose/GDP-mannose dehydrogenase family protein [bacterium]